MTQILSESGFFAIALTAVAFCIGTACQNKWKKAILNPILIGAALVMLTLWILDVPVEQYQRDCKPAFGWVASAASTFRVLSWSSSSWLHP